MREAPLSVELRSVSLFENDTTPRDNSDLSDLTRKGSKRELEVPVAEVL